MSRVYITLEIDLNEKEKLNKKELNELADKLTNLAEVAVIDSTLTMNIVDKVKAYNRGYTI